MPQGSILGPVFILYIKDIPHTARGCDVVMYADNNFLICDKDEFDIQCKTNLIIDKALHWFCDYNFIHFHAR